MKIQPRGSGSGSKMPGSGSVGPIATRMSPSAMAYNGFIGPPP